MSLQFSAGYYISIQVTIGLFRLLDVNAGYYKLLQVTAGYNRLLQITLDKNRLNRLLKVITIYFFLAFTKCASAKNTLFAMGRMNELDLKLNLKKINYVRAKFLHIAFPNIHI